MSSPLPHAWNLLLMGGRPAAARLRSWRQQARQVERSAKTSAGLSEAQLRRRVQELRWEARGGKDLARILAESYGLVMVAAQRALGFSQYPVQIMASVGLYEGHIIEMQTGEGKTLAATMPCVLRALPGWGSHVVTANDYLASRDAERMGKVYAELGLTCGCVLDQMSDDDRRAAYDCDITYGTATQLGFDFLRDRLKIGADSLLDAPSGPGQRPHPEAVQRGHYSALVDEADSVLIDDAVTPLLIGLAQENTLASLGLFAWCRDVVSDLRPDVDFIYEAHKRQAWLTDDGCRRILLRAKPPALDTVHVERIYEQVETALVAHVGLRRDRDYLVSQGEVVIVDESLGRKMVGRKWQRGLHQMVESKERLNVTDNTVHAAQVTIQTFFQRYRHLCGMTGTAIPARSEFRKVYRRRVTPVPTHRPCLRQALPSRVFSTQLAKWRAAAEIIAQLRDAGRAVLVGTPSIEESEALSAILREADVPHQTLNAHQDAREAEIISQAGSSGQVTIATNMAGRGTDILINDQVRAAGGLHVIATAMHTAARIDRQLVGRAARQGDPGSFQFLLSLQDLLLETLPARTKSRIASASKSAGDRELSASWLRTFRRAQRIHEGRDRKNRKELLKGERKRNEQAHKLGIDPIIEGQEDE